MRMFRVVILHPVIDARERGSGVGKRIDADIVALEGLHEGFGHAVALGAFHRREAGLEVQGCSDLEGAICSEDRTVVRQPLDPVGCPEVAKPLLNTLHHHIPDHLAGDSSCRCHLADDLAIMAVQCERNTDNIAIPADELEHAKHERCIDGAL